MQKFQTSANIVDRPSADEVGGLARTGLAWSTGLIISRQVLGLIVTSIMARLLLPSDYGLIGMASTLIALLTSFGDMGLSWATIQRKNLTLPQTHNLFWINVIVGVVLCGVCMVSAPLLADFYGEDRLVSVTMILGVSFALSGISVQPEALIRRHLQFKLLSIMGLSQFMIGSAVAVSIAWAGGGYWALVAQTITAQAARVTLALILSGYRPQMPRRHMGTAEMLRFGGFLTGSGLLIFFQRNLDNVLVGKVLGGEQLGYYSRAYFLMLLPSMLATGTLGSVMVPSLSALLDAPERFGRAYRQAVHWIAVVSFPMAAGLALVADEAVRLVYGDQWLPVVPILAWLSIVSLTQPVYNTYGWLFTAAGKGRVYFLSTVWATVVLSTAFAIGIRWGVVGLSACYAIAMTFLVTLPMLLLAHRAAGLELRLTLRCLYPVLAATLIMAFGTYGTGIYLNSIDTTWTNQLWIKSVVGACIYVAVLYLLDRPVRGETRKIWNNRIRRR